MRFQLAAACFLAVCAAAAPAAQQPNPVAEQPNFDSSGLQSSAKHAGFVSFVAPEPVNITAGKAEVIPLRFLVVDGFHINSHTPHTRELIPTQLAVEVVPGLNVMSVDFPVGGDYSFSFMPKEKLSVYSGEFVLHAHLVAKPGDHAFQALLRYQACDSTSCYPPKMIPVSFEVTAR